MRRRAIWGEPCDGCVESREWVQAFDREVRAKGDAASVVEDASERVQSLHAFRTLHRTRKYGESRARHDRSDETALTKRFSAYHMSLVLPEKHRRADESSA